MFVCLVEFQRQLPAWAVVIRNRDPNAYDKSALKLKVSRSGSLAVKTKFMCLSEVTSISLPPPHIHGRICWSASLLSGEIETGRKIRAGKRQTTDEGDKGKRETEKGYTCKRDRRKEDGRGERGIRERWRMGGSLL